MKLSLKLEYACQVLAQLGYYYGKKDLPHIDDLSKAEAIPSNYLVQILNELRNSGLITSRRGKQGGYALAREPREISLYDIVTAVDGELLGFASHEKGESSAKSAVVWEEVMRCLEVKTRSVSLEAFMKKPSETMWYI